MCERERERERERLRGIGRDSFRNLGYFSQERVREVEEGGRMRHKLPFCHHQHSMDMQTPTVPHFHSCQMVRRKRERRE